MGVDIGDMLVNLSQSYEPIYRLVTAFAYIFGLAFAFRALYHLKVYGELRTMMSSNTGLKEPLMLFLGAGVFIYLPTAFGILMLSSFGYESPLSYADLSRGVGMIGEALVKLIQIVGIIAFVRGWMLLIKATSSPQKETGKGITHIIGGLLAMNIVGTVQIVGNTLGLYY